MSPVTRQRKLYITSAMAQWLLLAMWGILAGFSYPRASLWPLAHLAPIPLTLLAVRGRPLWRAALWTWLAGFLWWLWMVGWLAQVTVPGYIVLCIYLGLYPMLYVAWLGWMHRMVPVPLVIGVPLVWVALEYLRGILMTGFPWFLLGHSQPVMLAQVADVGGAYLVSFITAMTAGLFCDLLTRPIARRSAGRPRMTGEIRFGLTLWLAVMILTVGYGWFRISQTDGIQARAREASALLRVAVVQTDVPQSNKISGTVEQDAADFERMVELTREAAMASPQLIAWPETMVPQPINDDAATLFDRLGYTHYADYRRAIQRLVQELGIALLAGGRASVDWQIEGEGEQATWVARQRFNSAYLVSDEGRMVDRYDKYHRVVFGEYVPNWLFMRSLLVKLTPYDFDYSLTQGGAIRPMDLTVSAAGNEQEWTIGVPICFEDVVSYVCRRMVYAAGTKRTDLLVNLTNDGWYPGSAQGWQHEQIARFRCIENRVPMARAVNRGISSMIDSAGRVTQRVRVDGKAQMVAGYAVDDLYRDPRRTWFGRLGDAFAVVCLLVSLAWGIMSWFGRRVRPTPR
jgi:apolipoprotein N-acyltransferase